MEAPSQAEINASFADAKIYLAANLPGWEDRMIPDDKLLAAVNVVLTSAAKVRAQQSKAPSP